MAGTLFYMGSRGVANLYVANVDGRARPVAVTSFPEGQIEQAFGRRFADGYFPHDGHLWQASIARAVVRLGEASVD